MSMNGNALTDVIQTFPSSGGSLLILPAASLFPWRLISNERMYSLSPSALLASSCSFDCRSANSAGLGCAIVFSPTLVSLRLRASRQVQQPPSPLSPVMLRTRRGEAIFLRCCKPLSPDSASQTLSTQDLSRLSTRRE
jgi:hypothetical protein